MSLFSAVAGPVVSRSLFMLAIYAGGALFVTSAATAGWQTAKLWKERAAKAKVEKSLDQATKDLKANAALIEQLVERNGALFEANGTLIEANGEEHTARVTLQAALAEAVKENQRVEDLANAARRARVVAEKALAASIDRENQARADLYASDPACGSWSHAVMCGALSRSLRERYQADQASADLAVAPGAGRSRAADLYADPARADHAAAPGQPVPAARLQ